MRARLTFTGKVEWNLQNRISWNANVQGCPNRAMHELLFVPDYALNDICFEGTVRWAKDQPNDGLVSGVKFSYVIPYTNEIIAKGEIL